MRLEEQVLSIEQAKHLQKLGMDMSDANLYWSNTFSVNKNHYSVVISEAIYADDCCIPTYTLQEVLNKLSATSGGLTLKLLKGTIGYVEIETGRMVKGYRFPMVNCLFGAAYHLLCWAVENKVLEEEK